MRHSLLVLMLAAPIGACSAFGEEPMRIAVPRTEIGERIPIPYDSVEVREVSLPSYAALEEISVEGPGGMLRSDLSLLWADDPSRAVTLELARALAEITSAQVAGEPWPFADRPEARIEVRIEEMLAGNDGQFRLSGQYFAGSVDGEDEEEPRTRVALFDLAVPYAAEGGAMAIASARGRAVRDLAELIARKGF